MNHFPSVYLYPTSLLCALLVSLYTSKSMIGLCVICRHQLVLSHLSPHVVSEYDEEGNPIPLLYSMEDISSKMQHVLTTLLNTYLGATGGRQEVHGGFGTSAGDNMDVNLFFLRKRPFVTTVNPTKQRKFTLFKFDNSQLAISKSSYLQEQQQQGSNGVVIEKCESMSMFYKYILFSTSSTLM